MSLNIIKIPTLYEEICVFIFRNKNRADIILRPYSECTTKATITTIQTVEFVKTLNTELVLVFHYNIWLVYEFSCRPFKNITTMWKLPCKDLC